MRTVDIDDMESRMGPADASHPLTDALGTTDVALNHFELAPGDAMSYGYHAHETQEEVFVPVAGAITFETEAGDVRVGAGQAVRFGPGEYQRGVNREDDRAVVIAIGAPKKGGETEVRRECSKCGDRTPQELEMTTDKSAVLTRCEKCNEVTGRFT
jgi:uncharacterized cupin superfamily protein